MNISHSKEEIEKILKEEDFEYHSVDLPFGLRTPGADRSDTIDLIFPKSFAGKTVLEIGSALGSVVFEAEKRGASRIVGTETNDKRFRQANILKDIKNSKIEFVNKDILSYGMSEQFDYVLLLNVLHHLKEPISCLRKISLITKERLIVEFPTFSDEKFNRNLFFIKNLSFIFNKLPIIGVSSLADRSTDQTFIFTPSAIKRIFLDHDNLFKSVKIIKSPIKGRMIAFCDK